DRPITATVAMIAPPTPIRYPRPSPDRRPCPTIQRDRRAAPSAAPMTTAAPGAPLQMADPARSLATIVDTVTAAMWPVLPSATPAISDPSDRRRRRARTLGARVA